MQIFLKIMHLKLDIARTFKEGFIKKPRNDDFFDILLTIGDIVM